MQWLIDINDDQRTRVCCSISSAESCTNWMTGVRVIGRHQKTLLHLRIRTLDSEGESLTSFLREAVPLYQAPGGITVRLLRSKADPRRFIEVIEYERVEDYQKDQTRIETDPEMIGLLERWRSLLADAVEMEVYEDVTDDIQSED